MKKMSWINAAAACAAGSLLFATSAHAAPASPIHFGPGLATFDNIDFGTEGIAVPNGYGSLNWANFYGLDAVNYDETSGYQAGVISPNNVILNWYANPAAIYSDGYAFMLKSAYLTAAWNNNLQVQVKGYFMGRLVYTRTYTLSDRNPTLVKFPSTLVSEVDFISSGGTPDYGDATHFVIDNLSVTVLPVYVRPFALKAPTIIVGG